MHTRPAFTRTELVVVLVLLLLITCFMVPAIEMSGTGLFLGWLYFLLRVVPQMQPAWDQVGVFVVGVLALTLLLHHLVRRTLPAWSLGRSVRVVGLVLLVFVAGTAFVGVMHQTGWLLFSKEPWLNRSGERIGSSNNLRQLVISLQNVVDTEKALPAGLVASPHGEPLHGWPTLLLPYIEQETLFKQLDLTKPWNDPANAKLTQTRIDLYQHPGRRGDEVAGRPAIHYAANVRVFASELRRKLSDFEAGASNTIVFGEVTGQFQPWAAPVQWRDPAFGLGHPAGFGSPVGLRQVAVAMLDGSVRTFTVGPDEAEFRAIGGG
jgi:hypothetical protein